MTVSVVLAAIAVLIALAALIWGLKYRALMRRREAELARSLAEWRAADNGVRRRDAEFSTLTRMVPAAIWMADEGGDVTFVNDCWQQITGQPLGAALGSGWGSVIHADDRARVERSWEAMVAGSTFEERYRVVRPDGAVRWLDDRGRPVEACDGVPAIFVGASLDVTEEMDADASMQARAAQQAVVATLGVRALAGRDDLAAVMQAASEEVAATLGVAWVVVQRHEPDGRSRRVAGCGTSPSGLTTSVSASIADGEARWGSLTATDSSARQFSGDDKNFLQAIANVLASAIERNASERETQHQAMHDTLTGLPNRALLKERLERAIERAGADGPAVGVVLLSLDHFKHINDSYGRAAGDDVLVALGERLQGSLRPGDTAARLSGDEFGLLCEDVAGEHDVASVAERFLQQMTEPFRVAGEGIVVSASAGVAFVPQGAHESIDPLSDADAALHLAKTGGRARCEIFDASMRERALERVQLESGLRRAAERDELRLAYQPVVSLRDGSVHGFEALVRWQHPQRGLLEPAAFIDIAEETGSIHELGAWVLDEACRQAMVWNAARPDAALLRISVNLSARQVARPALAGLIAATLERYCLAPAQLALELTETVLIEQTGQSTATLCALDELGVQLVLDDFGTGYSSLSHLKRFPLSELKLDRSYVAGLGSDTGDTAIVGAVLGIARTLGMSVTAEGIETAEQVVALQALGCPLGQGFHFARPLPAAEATRLLDMPALWLEGFALARD